MTRNGCPYCGRTHPPGAQFCPVTGKPLRPARARRILPCLLAGGIGAALICVGAGLLLTNYSPVSVQSAQRRPTAEVAEVEDGDTPTLTLRPPTLTATPIPPNTPTATVIPSLTPTAIPAVPSLSRTLHLQSPPMSGEDVRLAQQRLVELGYTEVGEIDGYFGAKTDSAVRRFQSVNGLAIDGVIGPRTWEQLFSANAVVAPPLPTASPTSAVFTGSIVFVSYRDSDEEIYIMNADGSNQTRLTYSQYGDVEPVLSPDGRFIVFVSQRGSGHKLFIMNADGSNPRQLTDGKSSDEYDPYFSTDGQWIVYSSSRGGRFELWLIHPDGTGLMQLTSGPNAKNLPAWSPDGQWIAYNSVQGDRDVIKIIRPDGTGDQVILTLDEAYVTGWSGGRILFVAENGSTTDIYSMNPDGSDIRQLTTDPANDKGAFGTPDGHFIVFNSARDGNDEIYVMRADGSDQTRLTFSARNDYMPTWGP